MFLKRIVFCLMCAAGLTAFAATSLPGKRSEWNGCERRDFIFDNRQATVVVPDSAAEGRPFAYINSDNCRRAKEFMPDVVIIKLGANDGKPCNWQ